MAIPEQLVGKRLVDTMWRRRVGKHRNRPFKMISYNGVCAIIESTPTRSWQGHGKAQKANIPWDMFIRLYEPIGELQNMETTVDQHGLVHAVTNPKYTEAKPPAPVFRRCNGPSHSPRGVDLDIAKFSYTDRVYQGGRKLRTECDQCVRYRRAYNERQKTKEPTAVAVTETEETEKDTKAITVEAKVLAQPRSLWEITIRTVTVTTVLATDFLDAASQFDNPDNIIKIERVG